MVSARHRRRTALVPLATLLAIALSVQATTDSRRVTFTIPTAPIALGLDALPIVTPEGAVRRVALVLRDDLRLPLPAEVTLRLYATPKLFEQGLVQDGGVAPSLAATISGLAVGASLESSLFLLEPSIGLGRSADSRRGVREWLRLVAHEMTHVGQVELAGGQAAPRNGWPRASPTGHRSWCSIACASSRCRPSATGVSPPSTPPARRSIWAASTTRAISSSGAGATARTRPTACRSRSPTGSSIATGSRGPGSTSRPSRTSAIAR